MPLNIREFAGRIEEAFKAASDARASGLLVHPAALFEENAQRIAEWAVRRRLPVMYGLRLYVDAGGPMSYSADIFGLFDRGGLRRQAPERSQARRPARRAADDVRAGGERQPPGRSG